MNATRKGKYDNNRKYCEAEGVEADIAAIPTCKTMNKINTGKLDKLIGEHVKEKKKDR